MKTPLKQHQVLFVDDENNFLETIRALFTTWSKNGWFVECATSADQALEILKNRNFDMVVVDVNMPVLDGEQFLRILARRYPDLKKVALTGHATEAKRAACLNAGAELFIEKPRSSDGLKSVFTMLDELVTWKQQTGFQGMLRKVGLQDVIQMECLGRNSSILEVHDQRLTGQIYIDEGHIIHATVGELTGEAAFQRILSLTGGAFELQPFQTPPAHSIEGQWEFLLMEAARVRDESASQVPEIQTATGITEPVPPLAAISTTPPIPLGVVVAETLICSGQGAPLYQWQCADTKARMTLLVEIGQQAARVGRLLPLGKFDRLEIQMSDGRAVAQVKPDRLIFVQVAAQNADS